MTTLQLNVIFLGEVLSTFRDGAFIKIPGRQQRGLLHKLQIKNARVDDVCKVLRRGEQVWCKIVYLDYNDNEIGLSMKLVDQRNGNDLDPRGVNYHRYEDEMEEMDNITTGFSNFIEDVAKLGNNASNEDFIKMCMSRNAKQRLP